MESRKEVIGMSFHATLDVSNNISIDTNRVRGGIPLNRQSWWWATGSRGGGKSYQL